ncbi:MAG: SPFH domain-containing protein, partial [Patescibacteria group bacterium]|nr:SPFH domain-containing protein [Patescibacteria group bacterium]
TAERSTDKQVTSPGRHRGLILVAALFLTGTWVLAGGYYLSTGAFGLQALSLQALLAAVGAWIAFNADRLRRAREEAEAIVESGQDEQAAAARRQWLSAGNRDLEETYHAVLADVEHGRRLHYLFVAVVPTALAAMLIGYSLFARAADTQPMSEAQATALGILCLAVSCLWLVLARSFAAIAESDLSESRAVALLMRESQWAAILASAGLFSRLVWTNVDWWIARIVLAWLMAVALEQLVRLLWTWLGRRAEGGPFLPPLSSFLRELVFVRGNPVASLFETIERHWGVSFRSSWAIRFVRRAVVPTAVMALLLFWGLSCLSMVGPSEMGIRESFGRMQKQPLGPGLHLKLPWPLGRVLRYEVKRIREQAIGFVRLNQRTDYLWTNRHAEEEFALVLGDGAEAVVVNAVVYYKIREDEAGFLDYALRFQNPDLALDGFGHRALMEKTRNSTVREILATNRAEFASDIAGLMQQYVEGERLGIEIVDVALFSLHPPIEAAPDYLGVISARIDAERYVTEATGERLERMETAAAEGEKAISEAKVDAARRVGKAIEESAEFVAVGQAYAVAPEAFELRLRGDIVQETLGNRPVILMDKSFTIQPGEFFFDFRGTRDGDKASQGEN